MGVHGLTSLIANNPQLLSDHKLSNCSLVIDGNNICYQLHRRFRCNIFTGGDYDVFYALCAEFFVMLRRCSIVPYVVFDGAHNLGDAKLKTTMNRAKDRLYKAKVMTQGYSVIGGFLPILALIVFEDVIRDLDILTFIHSDYEADEQIVGLANELECPVLSDDSDFFIYDLKGGFIPFGSFRTDTNVVDTEEQVYLNAKIYFVDNFIKNFDRFKLELLPLFAVLSGNDYVDDSELDSFYRRVVEVKKYSKTSLGCKLTFRKFENRMFSLLAWLRTKKTVEEALDVVGHHVKIQEKKESILDAVHSYGVGGSSYIAKELGIQGAQEDEGDKKDSVIVKSSDGSVLPSYLVFGCRRGEFPQFLMNVAVHRRAILIVQLEKWNLDSSYVSSLHLRRVIYGMLFPINSDDLEDKGCRPIVEIGRKCNAIRKTGVLPLRELPNGVSVPYFEEVCDFDLETRLRFLMSVLGISNHETSLSALPLNWQLFVCTVIYWVRSSQIQLTLQYLESLILMGIYVNIVSSRSIDNRANFLSDQDITTCKKRLLTYQINHPSFSKRHPPNVDCLHSFGELQTCLLFAHCLNCLLGRPLARFHVADFLNGTFLYNMNKDLITKQSDHSSFCKRLLGNDTLLYEFFCKIRTFVIERISTDTFGVESKPPPPPPSHQRNIRQNKRKSKKRR